jgi:hypothetical protein
MNAMPKLASIAFRLVGLVLLGLVATGCTQTLGEADCARHRDRLKAWGEQKGKSDPKAIEEFMKTCAGATVSRRTARCLDAAGDETTFLQCLD